MRRLPSGRPPASGRRTRAGNSYRRCIALLLLIALAFGAVTVRLVQLQAVSGDGYAARGVAQRVRSVTLPAERGSIFDRNGVELAMSAPQRTVWADPSRIDAPDVTATRLATILGTDPVPLAAKLAKDSTFVYVARQIDDTIAARIAELELPGVHILTESKRFAPAGSLALSVLGGTDVDNRGISGLEATMDRSLVGIPGSIRNERGPDGRTIAGGEERVIASQRGQDLVLTIDRSLQYEVEQALTEQVRKTNAEAGTAVVMDPATGEILAMANIGTDGPGNPVAIRENRAVTAAFEPGSVNKVITLAAALEEGVYEPTSVLTVPDRLPVSIHSFSDHDPHPPMQWTITDILTQSSNIGTIMVAQKLGKEKIDDYLRRFGLGKASGLGFPGETRGIMLDLKEWTGTSIGSIPIGQGVALNALQLLQVYNTLANDGVWVAPRLVRATVDAEGQEVPVEAPTSRRVVSSRTARQMTAMMQNVVRAGTGARAAIEGYAVAGKTGTARKPDKNNRAYEEGAYISSFAGFVPGSDRQLSVVVVIDEPRPVYYANLVAAPVFASITKYALRQFRIPPSVAPLASDVPAAQQGPVSMKD